jgi:hypothetical protein
LILSGGRSSSGRPRRQRKSGNADILSYSHADKAFVDRLVSQLLHVRAAAWHNRWELRAGDSLRQRIQDAIQGASAFVLSRVSGASEAPELGQMSPAATKQWFLREIAPSLRTIRAVAIMEAVGLSVPYCAKVRAGRGIPSRKHWHAFVKVARQQANPALINDPQGIR